MKKNLVVALVMVFAGLCAHAVNYVTATHKEGKYTIKINLDKADANETTYLEMSVYEDFGRVRSMKISPAELNAGEVRTRTFSDSALPEGDYYWRICLYSTKIEGSRWIYPRATDMQTLHMTGEPTQYNMHADDTEFEPVEFDDGTRLELSSVWLRSSVLGNHPYPGVDLHGFDNKRTIVYNHGVYVKDGVIYLCRGSWMSAGWASDPTRVWLLRYDLATGEELPMLRVYAPGGNAYPDALVMPRIHVDSDGTLYFTTYQVAISPKRMTMYTVDLSDVTPETTSVVAREAISLERKKGDMPELFAVKGSILSGDYEIWGYSDNESDMDNMDYTDWHVVRWTVRGGVATEEWSILPKTVSPTKASFRVKLYPVGDDCFYVCGCSMYGELIFPALYRFNVKAEAELLSSYTDEAMLPEEAEPQASGLAMPVIAGKQLLVYGIHAAGNPEATAARIVSTPSLTADFDTHKILWCPGDSKGFSTNDMQGLDAKYIPDDSENTGGILVLYLGNGALGVYRVNVTSPTVSIDQPGVAPVAVTYDGSYVNLGVKVAGAGVYDMQGRCIAAVTDVADRIFTGSLGKGVYIVKSGDNKQTMKLIVY